MRKPISILLDFDGTVTLSDLAVDILNEFGDENWREIDNKYLRGDTTLSQCIKELYSTLSGPKSNILSFVRNHVEFRDGFQEFLDFISSESIEVKILSAGVDFTIIECLKLLGVQIPIIAARTYFMGNKAYVDTKSIEFDGAPDFKSAIALKEQKENKFVIMIGDGYSDRFGAKQADFTIAVKDDVLERYSRDNALKYDTFSSFANIPKLLAKHNIISK